MIQNFIEVEEYKGDGADWNAFALSHPESRFCHLWQYSRAIKETYGYEAKGFVVKKAGQIIAVVPAVLAKSVLFGKKLVSQPFSEYGGILSNGMSASDCESLVRFLKEFCSDNGIRSIEMHGSIGLPEELLKQLIPANPYRYGVLKLDPDHDVLRNKVFDYSIRKALNKAERSQVKGFQDSSAEVIREKFWPLFILSMKRLGSPPHSLAYFLNLKRHYPESLRIFWAEVDGRLVSGLLGFAVGKRIQITNIVSDESSWELRPNDLVHWEFIKWGCDNGFTEFDFGSIRYDGQLKYKKKWGAEIKDCGYYFIAPDSGKRVKTFSSSSKTMERFSKIWSSYVPVALTPHLGPIIRKQLIR